VLWIGYNWAYVNPVFTWFSEQTMVGDPSLFIMVFFVFGVLFLTTTPFTNYFARGMDISADKLAKRIIGKPDVYGHYLDLIDAGKGVSGKRDTWTEIALMDTYEANKIKDQISK
jgi:Zn-dependent protease with chaperone function